METIRLIPAEAIPYSIRDYRAFKDELRLAREARPNKVVFPTEQRLLEDAHSGMRGGREEWANDFDARLNFHKQAGIDLMWEELRIFYEVNNQRTDVAELERIIHIIFNETIARMFAEQLSGFYDGLTPPEGSFIKPPAPAPMLMAEPIMREPKRGWRYWINCVICTGRSSRRDPPPPLLTRPPQKTAGEILTQILF